VCVCVRPILAMWTEPHLVRDVHCCHHGDGFALGVFRSWDLSQATTAAA